MTTATATPRLDGVGLVLSALCLFHCLAVPLIATGALAWAASESIHTGLTIALAVVVVAVAIPSYRRHRQLAVPVLLAVGLALLIGAVVGGEALGEAGETMLTVAGSITLMGGHVLNLRARSAAR